MTVNNIHDSVDLNVHRSRMEKFAEQEHGFVTGSVTKYAASRISANFKEKLETNGKADAVVKTSGKVVRVLGWMILTGLLGIVTFLALPISLARSISIQAARGLVPSVEKRLDHLIKAAKAFAAVAPTKSDTVEYGKMKEAAANFVHAVKRDTSDVEEVLKILRKARAEKATVTGAEFAFGLDRARRGGNAIEMIFNMAENQVTEQILVPRLRQEVAAILEEGVLSGESGKTSMDVVRERVQAILPYARNKDGDKMDQEEVLSAVLRSLKDVENLEKMKDELVAKRRGDEFEALKKEFNAENDQRIEALEKELGEAPRSGIAGYIWGKIPSVTGHRLNIVLLAEAKEKEARILADFLASNAVELSVTGKQIADESAHDVVSAPLKEARERYKVLKAAADEAEAKHEIVRKAIEDGEKELATRQTERAASTEAVSNRLNSKIELISAVIAA